MLSLTSTHPTAKRTRPTSAEAAPSAASAPGSVAMAVPLGHDRDAHEIGDVLGEDHEARRVLAGLDRLPVARVALRRAERSQREGPGRSIKQRLRGEDAVNHERGVDDGRVDDPLRALVDRKADAEREEQKRNHEAPEVEFAPISEWMARFGPCCERR